jgi:hypothetical protein
MFRRSLTTLVLLTLVLFASATAATDTQRDNRRSGIQVSVAEPVAYAPEPGGQVFWGYPAGYYDPWYWGWGPWGPYPGYYYYDWRPQLRVKVEPEEPGDDAKIYIDGAYAGVADDFDGVDQGMGFSEGPHTVVVYMDGYQTGKYTVHLREGSTFKIRHTLQPLAPGERSQLPEEMEEVPVPTTGSSPTRRPRY